MALEEVAVCFSQEEWALLDPGQRKLFWEVTEDSYEALAALRVYMSQNALPDRPALPLFGGVQQGTDSPRNGDGGGWAVRFPGASLLSCFPWLEGELDRCLSAEKQGSLPCLTAPITCCMNGLTPEDPCGHVFHPSWKYFSYCEFH